MPWALWSNTGGGSSFPASCDPCHVLALDLRCKSRSSPVLEGRVPGISSQFLPYEIAFVFKHLDISISVSQTQLCTIIFWPYFIQNVCFWRRGPIHISFNSLARNPLEDWLVQEGIAVVLLVKCCRYLFLRRQTQVSYWGRLLCLHPPSIGAVLAPACSSHPHIPAKLPWKPSKLSLLFVFLEAKFNSTSYYPITLSLGHSFFDIDLSADLSGPFVKM